MNTKRRPWLKVAVTTVSVGALTLGGVALPALAEEPVAATEAQSISPDKYELAAALNDTTAAEVEQQEAAGEILVAPSGHIAIIDPAHNAHEAPELGGDSSALAEAAAAIPGTPAGGSLPGAPITIYLDFGGETVTGSAWNEEEGSTPTMTFEPAAAADAAFQEQVWASVAEDYAPFNVNVTITDPGAAALEKDSLDDNVYGSHVVITDSYTDVMPVASGSGGIAYRGGAGAKYLAPAFVFTEGTGNVAKSVAEAAAHEVGHNFGLTHDGIGDEEYYHAGGGIWGPIMGASYVPPLTQWSNGDYAGATNDQDDLAVITDRGAKATGTTGNLVYADGTVYVGPVCPYNGSDPANAQIDDQFQVPGDGNLCDNTGAIVSFEKFYTDRADFRADTVGNTTGAATALDNSATAFEAAPNVILNRADVDVYSFTTGGGAFDATVDVAQIAPNLNSKLTLSDSTGATVAEANETVAVSGGLATGLDATVTVANLDAGVYYLSVEGVGQGDPSTVTPDEANGFSDYGSIGNYVLSGNAAPFDAADIVITSPADGDEVALGSVTVSGTAEPGAEVTLTSNGITSGPFTADGEGNWSGDIVSAYGENEIVASQVVGSIPVSVTDTVTVVVPVPAPVITAPADGAEINSVTFWGTGVPGAVVTLTYTVDGGTAQTGTATVDPDGNWTFAPTGLAAGVYTATATQSTGNVASPESEAVSFTILASSGSGGGTAGGDSTAGANGNGDGGNLPNTGSDASFASLGFAALALLLIGGGLTVVANRKRKVVSVEN